MVQEEECVGSRLEESSSLHCSETVLMHKLQRNGQILSAYLHISTAVLDENLFTAEARDAEL